jgi:hypothetical protein
MTTIKYPKGFRNGGNTQIAVRFPDELFKEIIKQAKREKKDFNAMVLDLIKCGKLDLEDSDRHEPSSQEDTNNLFADHAGNFFRNPTE